MSFDTENWLAEYHRKQQETAARAQNELRELTDQLKELKVDNVVITFNGGGDEGYIDYVDITPALVENEQETKDKLEEWAYRFLEGTGVDWYNNDGGFGELTINVAEEKFVYEINQYETTSSVADAGEINI